MSDNVAFIAAVRLKNGAKRIYRVSDVADHLAVRQAILDELPAAQAVLVSATPKKVATEPAKEAA